jgi:hypothetical protein
MECNEQEQNCWLSDRRDLSFDTLTDMPKTRKKAATAPDAPIMPQVGDKVIPPRSEMVYEILLLCPQSGRLGFALIVGFYRGKDLIYAARVRAGLSVGFLLGAEVVLSGAVSIVDSSTTPSWGFATRM